MTASYTGKNRRHWDQEADDYQRRHGRSLRQRPMAWGVWRIPEEELGILGDVAGKEVLELGCGAAQWSAALAEAGARPVGLDLSGRQLEHARDEMARRGVSFPLVQATGEHLPFADGSFDLVFADHGAMTFSNPRRAVPEVARVLRPRGLFAFSHDTPIHFMCWDPDEQRYVPRLVGDYFDMRSGDDEVSVVFQLPYAEWLRVFRQAGLVVEDLVELRPPPDAETTYEEYADLDWARRWPAEQIWRLRKPAGSDLVGVAEAARLLGWDKRRVATYVRRGSFPRPVAELAGGRVWVLEDVLAFRERFEARQRARRARGRR
ncbi:MAG TPA: class I SAM-dependent methyltransferase [Actinomycetota bacterium]|nr:class I SAM-dependent methyltransferase [Actinomycetota bacterium]